MASSNGYGQAADLPGLENMLHQFRVNELQMFLAAFKIAKLGKKNELVDRARQLLYQQRPPNQAVINKIREIHTKRFVPMQQQPQQPAHNRGSVSAGVAQPAVAASHNFLDSVGYQTAHQYNVARQQQYGAPVAAASAVAVSTNRARDLRMVELPFYEHLHTIVDPTELLVSHPNKNPQDMFVQFSVPEKFVSSVSYRSENQQLPRIELQLRFFLLDLSAEQKDDFPPNCTVRIDDQPVQLPNIIPTNKPNTEAKRPSRSVNITPYCQPPRFGGRYHRLQVTWTSDKRIWAVCLSVVRRLTSDILLKRLRNNTKMHRAADNTKRTIIRRLGGGADGDDIEMDSLRVSLLCPLGKIRMQVPTKPAQCEHLQCFDASLFLMMNEKKPTWKCPVCDNPARYSDLVVDGYFEQVLNEMNKSVTEIELLMDGTWKAVESDEGDSDDGDYASPAAHAASSAGSPAKAVSNSSVDPSFGTVAKSSGDDDDIIVLDDSDDEQTAAPSAASQSAMGRTHSLTASSAQHSAAHMNMRLRPSPCSPTQSEGGSSASDPSVICIDLADSSSSPPSRPGTGEANRASSASTALPYMQRTSSYSPSTPGYESMTPPVPSAPTTVNGAGVRRPANMYSASDRPPYKRMAMDNGDDAPSSSLQLPTVSMQHMTGYPHAVSSSTPGLTASAMTATYSQQPATYQQQSYPQRMTESNGSSWMNYQASVGYPSAVSNGYYGHHNSFDVATSTASMNGMSSYRPSTNMFNTSALPDFANVRVTQELQAFLNSLGMQPSSNGGVPFNHG